MAFSTYKTEMPKVEKYPFSEKKEMITLNKRLADYITKVRDLSKAASSGMDPSDYGKAMQGLESEVVTLMEIYGKEVNNLREKLEEANRNLAAERDCRCRLQSRIDELTNKLAALQGDNDKLKCESQTLQRSINKMREQMAPTVEEANNATRWRKENDDLRRALNDEVKRRQESEATGQGLRDKSDFDNKVKDQRIKELEERVRFQKAMIEALEKRLKSPVTDDKLPVALQELRDANAAEMRRLKLDTQKAMDNNLESLKQQVDDDKRIKEQMAKDIANLEDKMRKFAAQNKELEGQNLGLQAENEGLRGENERERLRQQQMINDMEKKMKELQEQLMSNVNNFIQARDAQATLRTEIDTYRTLLDQGQRRMNGPASYNNNNSAANQQLKKSVKFTDMRNVNAPQPNKCCNNNTTSFPVGPCCDKPASGGEPYRSGHNQQGASSYTGQYAQNQCPKPANCCPEPNKAGDCCRPADCYPPPTTCRPLVMTTERRMSRYPSTPQTEPRLGGRLVTLPAINTSQTPTQNQYTFRYNSNDGALAGNKDFRANNVNY